MDGAFGPMIFHGPENFKYENFKYDIDLGPILLTHYTHTEYFSYLLAPYHIPPDFLPADNNLINGKMLFDCSPSHDTICVIDASRSVFKFATGKSHFLRLINAGNSGIQKFSIDNHDLLVVTNDFVPVKPYKTKVVTLGVGQRSDVLVTAGGMPTDAVWMRSELDIECLNVTSIQPNATAAVYYPKANTKRLPQTRGVSWSYNKAPLLGDVFDGERSFSAQPESNVINLGTAPSVRLIVKNYFPFMHTMHLHGKSDFWVLAEGFGE
ncbi:Cupredoxin [Xylaria flabelliformis]|nr:Cupredoxin [Xylaria flabelliformis]